jgi:hypothetical protein
MPPSGMLGSVALVRSKVSEESNASIIKVKIMLFLRMMLRLLVTANIVSSLPILDTFLRNVDSYKSHTA